MKGKCLTISQPWASLIADGSKWIENRSWPTKYRGTLAIHAGKGLQYLDKEQLALYPSGCVIAVCRLVACVRIQQVLHIANSPGNERNERMPGSSRTWLEAAMNMHAEGPWCWILEDVWPCKPVPIRGAQGLWEADLPVLEHLDAVA